MTALTDYLASPECRKKVERWSLSTAMSGYSQDEQAIIDAGDAALNALCEQLREARADPYKGQWKRKCLQAEADRDALQGEVERLKVCGTCACIEHEVDYGRGYEPVCDCQNVCGGVTGPAAKEWYEHHSETGTSHTGAVDVSDKCHWNPPVWTPYWADQQEATPCPHAKHTYRNHGGTMVCADCGETLEAKP